MLTDPKKQQGGAFQYFKGTKDEVAACRAEGKPLQFEKIISPDMPGPGYAVMQQGNMVVHQAKALTALGERITMVNGYIPADPAFEDYTRYDQLTYADPLPIATAEYSRHVALHARRAIDETIKDIPFDKDERSMRTSFAICPQLSQKPSKILMRLTQQRWNILAISRAATVLSGLLTEGRVLFMKSIYDR